ncbi:MAG: hypothetical protein HOW73_16670 [Polyangiaceae bacterium]|nr:hypothetical protein [Polyangiaceae bacterium]
MAKVLAESLLWTLEYDEARHLLLARRTKAPWPLDEQGGSFVSLNLTVRAEGIDPHKTSLLVDLRNSPMRNDEEFEHAIAARRRELDSALRAFARSAYLVRTPAGKLQIQRYLREDGVSRPVFDDEAAAIRYLVQRDTVHRTAR